MLALVLVRVPVLCCGQILVEKEDRFWEGGCVGLPGGSDLGLGRGVGTQAWVRAWLGLV